MSPLTVDFIKTKSVYNVKENVFGNQAGNKSRTSSATLTIIILKTNGFLVKPVNINCNV